MLRPRFSHPWTLLHEAARVSRVVLLTDLRQFVWTTDRRGKPASKGWLFLTDSHSLTLAAQTFPDLFHRATNPIPREHTLDHDAIFQRSGKKSAFPVAVHAPRSFDVAPRQFPTRGVTHTAAPKKPFVLFAVWNVD